MANGEILAAYSDIDILIYLSQASNIRFFNDMQLTQLTKRGKGWRGRYDLKKFEPLFVVDRTLSLDLRSLPLHAATGRHGSHFSKSAPKLHPEITLVSGPLSRGEEKLIEPSPAFL